MVKAAIFMILLLPALVSAAGAPPILTLDRVVSSAQQSFPGLLAAEQRKQVAAGELTASEGGFDTLLTDVTQPLVFATLHKPFGWP
ncbi:hypothetical protein [Methylovulum psychrotolerans]|uniref:Uncharacterized protein n=1 Tax=Methylovulum psychrotolerans TaxID=1704499 RepID=A0A1Z4BXX8_9GAMM|nr:hypothetical protein [Methylovulum psychrotolerans]ASF46154.1 hypothetical protein CEK71_08690 [Methylovulum psychrotolerans]